MKWILFLPFIAFQSYGQSYFESHFGGTVGIVVNVGSHTNSMGVTFNGFYTDHFFQINTSSIFYVHASNLGERKNYIENRNALGVVLLGGKKNTSESFFFNDLKHQTTYNHGIGYSYIWYLDNRGTSQLSGAFGIHIKEFSLYHENDAFAGQARDRFRTAELLLSYRYQQFEFGTGIKLWTGESRNAKWQKIPGAKHPYGFKILENNPYGKTSNGILYISGNYLSPFKQVINFKAGIDSEEVRHVVQNRMFHDLIFMPKSFKRTTPHYPRLGNNGCAVFDKENSRPNRLYLQLGANNNWSF